MRGLNRDCTADLFCIIPTIKTWQYSQKLQSWNQSYEEISVLKTQNPKDWTFTLNFPLMLEAPQNNDKLKHLKKNIGLFKWGHSGTSSSMNSFIVNMFMYFPVFFLAMYILGNWNDIADNVAYCFFLQKR